MLPKRSHMEATLRVVKYITSAPDLGLFMPAQSIELLTTYYDFNCGTYLQIGKSITGYLVKFGDAFLSWKSKKQETVARSFVDTKFRSMASVIAKIN